MTALVPGIEIMAVDDLYDQFGKLTRSYALLDNPLHALTHIIPARAQFYCIVPPGQQRMARAIMKRIAGRRKLREQIVDKNEIRHPIFAPTQEVLVLYA